jgi:hypothetical protein
MTGVLDGSRLNLCAPFARKLRFDALTQRLRLMFGSSQSYHVYV